MGSYLSLAILGLLTGLPAISSAAPSPEVPEADARDLAIVPESFMDFTRRAADPSSAGGSCELNGAERRLAELLTNSREQARPRLACDPLLQKFARRRAADMVERGYFSHTTPDRVGPNQMLRASGYELPDIYAKGRGNNVESIAGGMVSPEEVWQALLKSPEHAPHVTGSTDFYKAQNEFGVAYVKENNSSHGTYWVVIIARRATPDDQEYACTPPPRVCFKVGSK